MKSFIPLSIESIKKNIHDEFLREQLAIDLFESIHSTNDYLKENANKYPSDKIHLCLAEQQTAGRGRVQNRQWHSPFGCNIYFSSTWSLNKNINDLSALTLVVALSIIKTLEAFNNKKFNINELSVKWPNDIYYQNKKLSGTLIDILETTLSSSCVVIGIGININMPEDQENIISQPWTSVQQILQSSIDRNLVIAQLIINLRNYLSVYIEENWEPFIAQWQAHDHLYNKDVELEVANKIFTGKGHGVNEKGQLLVMMADNTILTFSAGEVSLKKR